MARKKSPKSDNPEQSAKFIEAAQKLELVDNPDSGLISHFAAREEVRRRRR